MAPKRGANSKVVNSINYNNLKLSDSLCPICRSILIEPVTLSCNHGFCLSCFEGTMAHSNLVCPLCRKRIGSWLRSARKENKLVNVSLWQALKDQFPVQIKNRLDGLEENLSEDAPKVKLADPGEIRKEYELQKQKEVEQLQRQKELDERASESLLKKFKEELEYQKTIEEEKIRLDEQVARRLAQQLAQTQPSTSKCNPATAKKFTTLDSFLRSKSLVSTSDAHSKKHASERITYTSSMQKNLEAEFTCNVMLNKNSFANKEYKSIVLKQNKSNDPINTYASMSNLSFIKKKSQQLQKLTDMDCVSDSSDCIESECRYFKPIDYKYNPRSAFKPAIRVPSKFVTENLPAKIRPPNGKNLFNYSTTVSAFAKVASETETPAMSEESIEKAVINENNACVLDSSCNLEKESMSRGKKRNKKTAYSPRKRIKLLEEMCSTSKINGITVDVPTASESPPFCGFYKRNKMSNESKVFNNNVNGLDARENRLLQEKADLEYARKLQAELNNHSRYQTRSARTKRSRRQVTLDELMVPCKIK